MPLSTSIRNKSQKDFQERESLIYPVLKEKKSPIKSYNILYHRNLNCFRTNTELQIIDFYHQGESEIVRAISSYGSTIHNTVKPFFTSLGS